MHIQSGAYTEWCIVGTLHLRFSFRSRATTLTDLSHQVKHTSETQMLCQNNLFCDLSLTLHRVRLSCSSTVLILKNIWMFLICILYPCRAALSHHSDGTYIYSDLILNVVSLHRYCALLVSEPPKSRLSDISFHASILSILIPIKQ